MNFVRGIYLMTIRTEMLLCFPSKTGNETLIAFKEILSTTSKQIDNPQKPQNILKTNIPQVPKVVFHSFHTTIEHLRKLKNFTPFTRKQSSNKLLKEKYFE